MFSFIWPFFRSARTKRNNATPHDEEAAPLLEEDGSQSNEHSSIDTPPPRYGSTDNITADVPKHAHLDSADKSDSKQANDEQEEEKPTKEKRHWWTYLREFAIFLPFIWPSRNVRLQLHLVGVVLCLIAIRCLNVLAPRQLGIVINSFGKSPGHLPVSDLVLYLFFDWLTASSITGSIKDYLWLAVEQNAHKAIVSATFNHIMGLSCDFHDDKKSGELYMSMSQGSSVYSLFQDAFLEILPMLVDLGVACVYLSLLFGSLMALLVAATTIIYLCTLKYLAAMQVDILRQKTEAVRKEYQVLFDAMGNWIAVAFFGNFEYEKERYIAAVEVHLKMRLKATVLRDLAQIIQASILHVGFVAATFLAAYQISIGKITVGEFVLLLNYWARFTGNVLIASQIIKLLTERSDPLSIFYYFSRHVQDNLVEAEKLMELLREEPSVPDGPGNFEFRGGSVTFENVSFTYNEGKPATIRDLSFRAEPGQTIAMVGATGSGKSTLLKLLFRFYDVNQGSIKIDDQDIRDVTFASLHEHIGVVPQSPVLFNDTIMHNVRYSKLDATDEQVIEACQAAAIHDQIIAFPDGYASVVGEKGVKLSGGEIQRIDIASALLKNPRIILLD